MAGAILAGACLSVQAASLSGPSGAALTLESPAAWSLGLVLALDEREWAVGTTPGEIDTTHIGAALETDVADRVTLRAGAGWSRASLDGRKGDGGFAWNLGARAALLAIDLDPSPVAPRHETLALLLDVDYSGGDANLEQSFTWTAIRVTPLLRYAQRAGARSAWRPGRPAFAVEAGGAWEQRDGDLGPLALETRREAALHLGAEISPADQWSVRLETNIFSGGDRSIACTIACHL